MCRLTLTEIRWTLRRGQNMCWVNAARLPFWHLYARQAVLKLIATWCE